MPETFGIDIIQPIVPEYRVALFERLGRRWGNRVAIQAADAMGIDKSYPLTVMASDYSHPFVRVGPFLWQKRLRFNKARNKGDVLVICGDIHQLSSLWMAIRARFKGIRVLWWGHHKSALARPIFVRIRLFVARHLADCMLCYTDEGINYLIHAGFVRQRVFATGNTIDFQAITEAIAAWPTAKIQPFRQVHGMKGYRVLLFCGVLREKTRVDVLLRAIAILNKDRVNYRAVVIGDGPCRPVWEALAKELKLHDVVTWLGEVREQMSLAPWFLSANLFIYPGCVGLSVIHALGYGLPVILNDNSNNQEPEYAAFHPFENGFAFKENDVDSLAQTISGAFHNLNLPRIGTAGQDFMRVNFSMNRMAERFAEAVESCANIR